MAEPDDLDARVTGIERQLDELSNAVESLAELLTSLRDALVSDGSEPTVSPPLSPARDGCQWWRHSRHRRRFRR